MIGFTVPHLSCGPAVRLQLVEQLLRRLLAITLRVVLGPLPQIDTRVLERLLRLPSKLVIGTLCLCCKVEHVTSTTPDNVVFELFATGGLESVNHIIHGRASAGAQVPRAHTGLLVANIVEGDQVTTRKVMDVQVVPDSGTVLGIVVWN